MTRKATAAPAPVSSPDSSPIVVRDSKVHGRGVFATRKIPEGSFIIEYMGERITEREANRRKAADPDNPFHTFFFSLENGKMIDGDADGNDARWINHSCEPNCEAREEKGRIFIHALRDIKRGEELNYDYGLILEERHTPAVKRAYACLCGSSQCRGTLLAPKRR
ncbi:SET domain-containing protein-lysine N-methyltransferase [Oxalobacteraceae bacterium R-40]|uniref:SET domain-containing protein-lysine N-methyltransferase n=1 Tax=Keguizhuia sedimenti TaxID=3064264 RepID=A0ABU1BK87_9BURK|nr:SET domain-containing protein-lysine N-methyltransferase [Oxalobacteraceae bacterium R-40]